MASHRNVVEEHRFVRELAAIDADVHRTDAALEYVKELLARYVVAPTAVHLISVVRG